MSYTSFPGQSPSGGEFGFPRLAGTPDRQRLGLDFLQRPSSGTSILNSPPSFVSPKGVLGIPPLPIFQPSPMRASQISTYLSPDSKGKRRQSDISEFQRFSMSPGYSQELGGNGSKGIPLGEGKNCLTSAFADILDGHSRVSPKHFTGKAGPKSDKKDLGEAFWKDAVVNNASNSPLQLKEEVSLSQGLIQDQEKAKIRGRKSLDFSDVRLPLMEGQNTARSYPASPRLTSHVIENLGNLLPIHPLENGPRERSPEKPSQMYSHLNLELNTSTQSPMGAKIGLIRREDIIDSPAVKEATDAAVAAAMRANASMYNHIDPVFNLKRPQRAAAAGVAAAAAAAASGTLKGKRSGTCQTSSLTSNRSDDAIFTPAIIPGIMAVAPTKCKCKKSKCLKLYCECFKARGYCGDDCSCEGCSNKPGCDDDIENARDIILTRNPQAFADKIAETVVPSQGGLMTSGIHHTKGCNCKKSKCQKKYCECFQAGVPCGDHCKCNGCANTAHHHDTVRSQAPSMTGPPSHYQVSASMREKFFQSLSQNHSTSMDAMRKIVQQNIKSDVSSTLIPVTWMSVDEASDGNFPGRAEVIEGLTPIAPPNLEIKTEKR